MIENEQEYKPIEVEAAVDNAYRIAEDLDETARKSPNSSNSLRKCLTQSTGTEHTTPKR